MTAKNSAIFRFIAACNAVLKKLLAFVCALLMAVLTLVVLWGVLTRYIYGEQPAFTEEFARMFLVCVTFFGGAFAFSDGSHIGLDFLSSRFTAGGRRTCAVVAVGASMFFACAVLVFGGIMFISTSMESANMLVSAPVYQWQIYLCVPLSGVFSAMFLLESMMRVLSEGDGGSNEKLSEDGREM